jgi:predicted transcriptional regulator
MCIGESVEFCGHIISPIVLKHLKICFLDIAHNLALMAMTIQKQFQCYVDRVSSIHMLPAVIFSRNSVENLGG